MARIAIIAAMEREVEPLLRSKGWRKHKTPGVGGNCYERDGAVVVCAGIGEVQAGRAAEAIIAGYTPTLVISAGLAGALTSAGKVGQVVCPAVIICSAKGVAVRFVSPPDIAGLRRAGTLVTASDVAGEDAKRSLALQYSADAIDMEAAAVAEVAAAHGIAFLAVKAISDEYNFPMPNLARFIDRRGRFRTGHFALHVALRPSMWRMVNRLTSNCREASRTLCATLGVLTESNAGSGGHSMKLEEFQEQQHS